MGPKLNIEKCQTSIEFREVDFSWTIKNFSVCNKINGQKLQSETFPTSDEFKWSLWLYPFGETDDSKEYVSLYLILLSGKNGGTVANYKLNLLNKDGLLLCRNTFRQDNFSTFGSGWGHQKMDKRSHLLLLLKEDVLVVNCIVKWETKVVNTRENLVKFDLLNVQNQLLNDFKQLAEDGTFSDVSIYAKDGTKFLAHKCVLAARSSVFAAMFEHDMIEKQESIVKIEDLNADVMKQMLQFIYTNNVDKKACDVDELLAAADKYDLKHLKTFCEHEICEKLQTDNLAMYLLLADKHEAKILKKRALELLATNLKDAIKTEALKGLSSANPNLFYECIKTVLKDD